MGQGYKEYLVRYRISGSNIIREISLIRAQSVLKARKKAIEVLSEAGMKNVSIISVYDRRKLN